jgi:predicted GIY-YIG superfamily endonuclease
VYKELTGAHQLLKERVEKYLRDKQKSSGKKTFTFEDQKQLLFEFCTTQRCLPKSKAVYKECPIGQWLSNQKQKLHSNSQALYQELSVNPLVKAELDRYLKEKQQPKQSKLTIPQ